MKNRKWTYEAYSVLLKQHRDGDRPCDIAIKLDLSIHTVRQLLDRAKQLEGRVAGPFDTLSARTRNRLLGENFRTIEDVFTAIADGSINDVENLGPVGKKEILVWLSHHVSEL